MTLSDCINAARAAGYRVTFDDEDGGWWITVDGGWRIVNPRKRAPPTGLYTRERDAWMDAALLASQNQNQTSNKPKVNDD